MKHLLYSIICVVALFATSSASTAWSSSYVTMGKEYKISIIIKSKENGAEEPVIGATVYVKGKDNTTSGYVSDLDGKVVITVKRFPVTISVSYIGYKSQEYIIKSPVSEFVVCMEYESGDIIGSDVVKQTSF